MDESKVILPERLLEEKKPAKAKKQPKVPKEPKLAKEPKPAKEFKLTAAQKEKTPSDAAVALDPNSMFKEGFLKAVYAERPSKHVITRFPPEPNGYLHIGHSKAIAINFGFARYYGGDCYLRYDDTNPEKEEEKYFTAILEMIEWLGFKPYKITYSSDNFQKLYDLAEDLINRDGAYVCHCSDTEVKKQRGEGKGLERYSCSHRDRPIEESLVEFRAMRDGNYKPREAVLRMKQDMQDGNPQMWDLTAYRILEAEHHRSGNKWRIYPTYDYTHCLCDSFEDITHSLCTTEFQLSRVSYEWLCDAVKVYKPMQREYGRLNVTGTVLSKRKIAKLVDEKIVRGWDDPRLYTLVALRRRGVPPGAILSFVNELGVSTANTNIQLARFEQVVRRYLEQTVPRLMLVLDPIPVIIDNLPDDYLEDIELPFSPKDPTMGNHIVPFTKTVYIDRSDFREVDSKDYFRLAPGKAVGLLKVPFPIKATSFEKDETTGLVTEVHATYEKPEEGSAFKKPKTYIQWVASSPKHKSPIRAEVRIFSALFKSENPDSAEGGFMADLNSHSEEIYPNAMIETGFNEVRARAPWPEKEGEKAVKDEKTDPSSSEAHTSEDITTKSSLIAHPETVRFQGLRVAYFAMDTDSTDGKIVLNRIVSLKEDSGKA
ncbi:hypothetical protein MMC17_009366 [Xylographa soralifera]|nr:hypothetical protein [Xylographa soralifera]